MLNNLDNFSKLLYENDCKEKLKYNLKPYESYEKFVEQQSDYIQTKFDMEKFSEKKWKKTFTFY